ncbi:28132_t:CDS:2 [Dentiscutata erythropus]|uniref:28132_t:CDS:1 n=1 Tax=Dentiscutata erythropus TaxID=1348616 RepID=A0A9N9FM82_9GLOM|nr:28132_t:CDS:2 [Dentiscutata erythropus]
MSLLKTTTISNNKLYAISVIILSVMTFCALSAFCSCAFVIKFCVWFLVNVIGGIASNLKSKFFNVISRKRNGLRKDCKTSSKNGSSALSSVDNGGNNNEAFNAYFFDIPLDSDLFIPSEFSMARSLSEKPHVLVRSELTLKKLQKKNSCHIPDIPSPLGPNRQKEWIKSIDYFPSERHSKHIKSKKAKLSMSDKMIESTAAYRVGKKCRGWQNGDAEEYAIKRLQGKNTEPIELVSFSEDKIDQVKDINVRLDQERPNLIRKERGYFCSNPNNSPAAVLKCARQYLTILLTIKKRMNL